MNVGITGQSGFIGVHLYASLRLEENIKLVDFNRGWFESPSLMKSFTESCDCIVHLAAVSRSDEPKSMYDSNMRMVTSLAAAAESSGRNISILFASTTHESRDTLYHASKRDGRKLLEEIALRNSNITSSTLLMPNVFGPYSKPFWNSAVSTFCHLAAAGKKPEKITDDIVRLIHVGQLCREIRNIIKSENRRSVYAIDHTYERKVSDIWARLEYFKVQSDAGRVPVLDDSFDADLFSTFTSYARSI